MGKTHWTRSRKISALEAEVLLELLAKAYPGQVHSTQISSDLGITLDEVRSQRPSSKRGWKLRSLSKVDLQRNNALQKPLRVGRSWLITPPGSLPSTRRQVIQMEAGMGFGSGAHETTQLCLRLLESLPPQGAFLDLGTGSGILAIGAARIGFKPVDALEIDASALRQARQNGVQNQLKIQWIHSSLERWKPKRSYHVVAANLLSGLLLDACPRIAAMVRSNGRLILSGFLRKEVAHVQERFQRAGFRTRRILRQGRWASLLMTH